MIVKICGIKTAAAAKMASEAGADFIGFVFAPSRRRIEPAAAAKICQAVNRVKKIGVFVDEDPAKVNAIAAACGLDFVQLHGHETACYRQQINYPVIKAFRVGDDFQPLAAESYPAEMILLDRFLPGPEGGTGTTFFWAQAATAVRTLKRPVILAGGLTAENVSAGMELFHPFGVDVSGGVEENGEKSLVKIKRFMEAARRAERRLDDEKYT